jgi:hypothetical protein
MTLIDVVVIVCTVLLLAVIIVPAFINKSVHSGRINCINNLKEVTLGYIIWAGDNNDKFPMQISVTNGGTMEYAREEMP